VLAEEVPSGSAPAVHLAVIAETLAAALRLCSREPVPGQARVADSLADVALAALLGVRATGTADPMRAVSVRAVYRARCRLRAQRRSQKVL
jgi:hypothetical protein